MRVAVLCTGPSLAAWLSRPDFADHCDLLIGVNHAAAAVPCHWWVALDWRAFSMIRPMGKPWVFTRREAFDHHLQNVAFAAGFRFAEDFHPGCEARAHWERASMTAAIVLAEDLTKNCTQRAIELYGADLKGTTYFDGHEYPHNQERWTMEENYLGIQEAWLRSKGVEFKRMAAPGGAGAQAEGMEALAATG